MNSTVITFLLNTTMTIATMNLTDNATASFSKFICLYDMLNINLKDVVKYNK